MNALLQVGISVAATVTAALLLGAARAVLQMMRAVRTTARAVKELTDSVGTLHDRVDDLERGRPPRRAPGQRRTTRES